MQIILKYFTDFTDEQLRQFRLLKPLYEEWNEKINVISRKDIDGLYEKHVLHSLSIAAIFEFADGSEIMDLGTGGGFPGIPLAIYFPKVRFHLVDSIAKKIKVVSAITEALGLKNITTGIIRAEEMKRKGSGFDFIVSRAVAPLKDLWSWSRPLLKNSKIRPAVRGPNHESLPGLICLKGGNLTGEIKESGTNPQVFEIFEIFPEIFFKDKHLLICTG